MSEVLNLPIRLPSKKTAYFVIGAESSGNKMMVQCLCASGCYGNPNQSENMDDLCFDGLPDRIAFTRSVPYGDTMPDPRPIAKLMQIAGYDVIPIYMYRKTDFVVASQLKYGHAVSSVETKRSVEIAARIAIEFATWLSRPLTTIIYELFVLHPYIRDHLFYQLGLPPTSMELFNANEGYDLKSRPTVF